jgi:CPA2 family monovalent cation:H+ antiporter-2
VSQLENYIFIAIALIAIALGMKLGGNLLGNIMLRQPKPKALRSAFTLAAPRGEFSIVIIKVGVDAGVVSAFLFGRVYLVFGILRWCILLLIWCV